MRYELKSIGVWALIKVTFFLSLAFGFLVGLFYAVVIIPIFTAVGGLAGIDNSAFQELPSVGVLVVLLPIMFALFSAVFNSVFSLFMVGVYNLIARLLGGLEFQLDVLPESGQVLTAAPIPPPVYTPSVAPAAPAGVTPAPPPPPPPAPPSYRPTPPPSAMAQVAPQPEMRPETLEETPPAPIEPDEDGPMHDES